jgi:sporulation protein YlmC with PRC-barrel domain
MNKHVLALSTALSILAFTPAFAQEQTPAAPAVDCTLPENASNTACANQQQKQNTQGQPGQQTMGDLIVPADQLNNAQLMSASDYIGKTVYDQAGNNIGEVNDLIVSGDGNVEAVILGVGGFLGIGEKDVAVNTNAVQMVQDGDTQRLVVQATKETLEGAPSYDRSNRRYATDTGTGTTTETTGSTTTAPATGGAVDCALPENASNAACVNQQQQNQQQQQQNQQ